MVIDSIYYLDQFSKNIVKTNSDQSLSEVIENIAPLEVDEPLVNLQASATHLYLFGEAAAILRRPITGTTWETIQTVSQQTSILNSPDAIQPLSAESPKQRQHIVTNSNYVYTAHLTKSAQNLYTTHVLCFNGSSWSKLKSLPGEMYFGWVDLNFSTDLVGLKTSIEKSTPITNGWVEDTIYTQQYKNANNLSIFQNGASVATIPAPTNLTVPEITVNPTFVVSPDPNIIQGFKRLSNGDVVGVCSSYLVRFDSAGVGTIHNLTNTLTYGGDFLEIGNYLVVFQNLWNISRDYLIYDLQNYTVFHGNLDVPAYQSNIRMTPTSNGRVFMLDQVSGQTWILDPSSHSVTAQAAHPLAGGGTVCGGAFTSLANGDSLWSGYLNYNIYRYNVASNTWTVYSGGILNQYGTGYFRSIQAAGKPWDGCILMVGDVSGGSAYAIFNPATGTIIYQSSITSNAVPIGSNPIFSYPYVGTLGSVEAIRVNIENEEVIDIPLSSAPTGLPSAQDASFKDSTTLQTQLLEFATNQDSRACLTKYEVSLTQTAPAHAVANYQAVTAISPTEVYCATVKAEHSSSYAYQLQYCQIAEPSLILYRWDGSIWTSLGELSDPSYTWSALLWWGEGNQHMMMPYTPLLMSSHYVANQLELLLLRDTSSSAFTYKAGVFKPAIMTATPSGGVIYEGEQAPSIPFDRNKDFSSIVSLYATLPGQPYYPNRNEVQVYAEARLLYKPNYSTYVLIHNKEILFTTTLPIGYDSSTAIQVAPGSTYYVGGIPFTSDAPVASQARLVNVNPSLTPLIEVVANSKVSFKAQVAGGIASNNPMSATLQVAAGGMYSGSSMSQVDNFFNAPVMPAAKYFPANSYPNYAGIGTIGSSVYATGSNGVVVSTDFGNTWQIPDTFVCPIEEITDNWGTTRNIVPIQGVVEGAPSPAVFSNVGVQSSGQYIQRIVTLPPPPVVVPDLTTPLPVPYDNATPLNLSSGDSGIISGIIDSNDPIYAPYTVHCDAYTFKLTSRMNITVVMTSSGSGNWSYLTLNKLDGSPGSYSEIQIDGRGGSGITTTITATLDPGVYFIIPQGYNLGDLGTYTLQVQVVQEVAKIPKIRRMVYDGTRYLGIISNPNGNEDYESNIAISTDLQTWNLYSSVYQSGQSYSGYGYYNLTALRTAGGTTLAAIGDRILRIDASGASVSTLDASFNPNYSLWSLSTDGSGHWVAVVSGVPFASLDDGRTFSSLTARLYAINNGFITPYFTDYVGGRFVILGWSSPRLDQVSSPVADFSTDAAASLDTLPGLYEQYYDLRAVGSNLVLLCQDHVRVSTDLGLSWGVPRILTLTASPSTITAGQTSTLTWTTAGAVSASFNQGIGAVAASGSRGVTPSVNTTYTISAAADSTVTRTVTVYVTAAAVITSLAVAPGINYSQGGWYNVVSWTTTGASSLTLDPGNLTVASSGSRGVNPSSTTTYTLTARNSQGISVNQSVLVNPCWLWLGMVTVGGNVTLISSESPNTPLAHIVRSSDGATWTEVSTLSGYVGGYSGYNDKNSVKFINNKYYLVSGDGASSGSAGGKIWSSPDGITWTQAPTVPVGSFQSIAYGAGKYAVATMGSAGYGNPNNGIVTSTDGITFVNATSPNNWYRDIIFANNLFVAVGQGILTSSDGVTWTQRSVIGTNYFPWASVAYSGSLFVAIDAAGGNHTATSPDGVTWTTHTTTLPSGQGTQVIWDGSRFVSLTRTSDTTFLYSSTDGINWTSIATWGPTPYIGGYNDYGTSIAYLPSISKYVVATYMGQIKLFP